MFLPRVDPEHRLLADMRPLELLIDGLPPDTDVEALHQSLGDYPTATGARMAHVPGMRDDLIVSKPSPRGHPCPCLHGEMFRRNVHVRAERLTRSPLTTGDSAPAYCSLALAARTRSPR